MEVIYVTAAIILRLMKVEVAAIKKSTNIRYRNDWMDFRKDGLEPKERIKGKDKRRLGKWSRKKFLKENDKDYEAEDYEKSN